MIWLTGFSGGKEAVEPQLRTLAERGFVALSYDPYQHGERRCETQPELVARVRGNIRRYFWPILGQTAEEASTVIDWAITNLRVRPQVGFGGISMGGDIAIAAAGVEPRIVAAAGCIATPDWMRPGSFEPPGEPDHVAQDWYDRRNPLTHLAAYRDCPALTFQCGAEDRQVPPDGAQRFAAALSSTYAHSPERLNVTLHPTTPHAFIPAMLENSIRWFERFIP